MMENEVFAVVNFYFLSTLNKLVTLNKMDQVYLWKGGRVISIIYHESDVTLETKRVNNTCGSGASVRCRIGDGFESNSISLT